MTKTQISLVQTLKKKAQVLFGADGQPASVILPFDLFTKLLPSKEPLDEILKASSRAARASKVKLSDLLQVSDRVRQELYLERYSQ